MNNIMLSNDVIFKYNGLLLTLYEQKDNGI